MHYLAAARRRLSLPTHQSQPLVHLLQSDAVLHGAKQLLHTFTSLAKPSQTVGYTHGMVRLAIA